jgi:hypothetical protein
VHKRGQHDEKNASHRQLIEPSSDLHGRLVLGHDHCEYQEGAERPAAATVDRGGKGHCRSKPETTSTLPSTPAIPSITPFIIHETYDH